MNPPYDSQFLQTVAIVLQDLECFITQKNNQSLIYALLEIKRTARKSRIHQPHSIERKSNASQSHKNYSDRKSSLSVHSHAKSVSKQSQASFDIIKGAQIFNQTRKKGIQSKLYTQTYQPQPDYFIHENQQPSTLSQPSQRNFEPVTKVNTTIPKLVGLVSSEQISDIQQPFGIQSRNNPKINMRQYQNSIQQVDDDDDQFQDIVLNRLDVIEQKVNQMLRQKRHQRLSTLNSKIPQNHSYHLSKSKLNNVGSGPNILYSKNLNNTTNLYKYPESPYPNSTNLMSPRVYTFHNSKNTSLNPSSKKMTNRSFKPNLTDRNANIQRISLHQNYFTDNQNYPAQEFPGQSQFINDQIYEEENPSQFIEKSKKLGHYRDSSKTLHQREENQQVFRPHERVQKTLETTINFAKIKEQAIDDKAFKYIPLSKINQNKTQNIPEKTERQISRRNLDSRQINYKTSQNFVNKNQTMIVEKGIKNYETSSQKNPNYEKSVKVQSKRNEDKYRSGRDSGVRGNNLNGSEVRAYTEHGDYIKNEEDLSVASEKDIYSQIRELREITRLYGAERQKKYMNQAQRQIPQVITIDGMNPHEKNYDYRYHQKTERQKYPMSRNHAQQHEYEQEEKVILQGNYPKERVVKVIKKIPHYPPQIQALHNNRIPQRVQYVQYETHEQVVYQQPYQTKAYNNSGYVVRQRQGPSYEQVSELYEENYYGGPQENRVKTVILKDETNSKISQRKMSSGSMNSFKSIPYVRTEGNPYVRTQGNPSVHNEKSIEYVVERPIRYVQAPAYKDY